jgi:peptidoglycan/xylan/chitin deacetylase (PgdA/CDA1 family)
VPILTYHHITENPVGGAQISPETFEAQIKALYDNGYTAISFEELEAYVTQGTELPDNPVIITFDDGYYSNYEYAFPILKRYDMKAAIFVIGVSVGKDTYKDTDFDMTPHFGWEEANQMIASGLVSIHSHTYDMHQWAPFEDENKSIRSRYCSMRMRVRKIMLKP